MSFQSDPCAPGHQTVNSRHYVPDPPTRPAQRQSVRTDASQDVRRRSPTGARVPAQVSPTRCEVAKAERERTLQNVGLKRTYDLLSRNQVIAAESPADHGDSVVVHRVPCVYGNPAKPGPESHSGSVPSLVYFA